MMFLFTELQDLGHATMGVQDQNQGHPWARTHCGQLG